MNKDLGQNENASALTCEIFHIIIHENKIKINPLVLPRKHPLMAFNVKD